MTMPLANVGIFLAALTTQILGASLLPRTEAFTNPTWTALSLGAYILSLWLIAVLIKQGAALSIIVPLMAAAVPLATIAVAYFVYSDPVSPAKLGFLVGACCAIGYAGTMA